LQEFGSFACFGIAMVCVASKCANARWPLLCPRRIVHNNWLNDIYIYLGDIYVCRIYSFYHYLFPGVRCQFDCIKYPWNPRHLKIECL